MTQNMSRLLSEIALEPVTAERLETGLIRVTVLRVPQTVYLTPNEAAELWHALGVAMEAGR